MAAYIAISELNLKKSKIKQDGFSVYTDLIDFFGDTEDELVGMINFLCKKGLVSFPVIECIMYKNKYMVYHDGSESTQWVLDIAKALKEYNDKIKIVIHEQYILNKGILNLEFLNEIQEDMEKTIVTLYTNTLMQEAKSIDLGDMIKCKVSNENNNRFIAQYRSGYVTISKNTRYRVNKQSSIDNKALNIIKVNKTKARNLYHSGKTIYLLPCKVTLENMWVKPISISNNSNSNFDIMVNEFEYYNCNKELGTYASYYIEND